VVGCKLNREDGEGFRRAAGLAWRRSPAVPTPATVAWRALRQLAFTPALPKQGREGAGVRLDEEVVGAAAIGARIFLAGSRDAPPERRSEAGAGPRVRRQEQAQAPGEMARRVAAHRSDRRALDLDPKREERVVAPELALPHPLGKVSERATRRARDKLAGVGAEPVPSAPERLEEGRIGTAEQRQEADRRARALELPRELEGDDAAGAEPGDDDRSAGMGGPDLRREIAGEVLEPGQRPVAAVQSRRLQAEEGASGRWRANRR